MMLDTDFMVEAFFLALQGIPVTLGMTAAALLFAVPLGFGIAVVRSGSKHKAASRILGVYVSYTRGVPIIVQILIVYALLPSLVKDVVDVFGLGIDVYSIPNAVYAVFLFAYWSTAFFSETFRSGLLGIGRGQYEAAVANGLSGFQAYARVVAPQVFSSLLPVLCTNVNSLIKMTSLSFNMAVMDVTGIVQVAAGNNLCFLEAYLVIAVIYVIICLAVELVFKVFEHREAQKRGEGTCLA